MSSIKDSNVTRQTIPVDPSADFQLPTGYAGEESRIFYNRIFDHRVNGKNSNHFEGRPVPDYLR